MPFSKKSTLTNFPIIILFKCFFYRHFFIISSKTQNNYFDGFDSLNKKKIEKGISKKSLILKISYATVKKIVTRKKTEEYYEKNFKTQYEKRNRRNTSHTNKQLEVEILNAYDEIMKS